MPCYEKKGGRKAHTVFLVCLISILFSSIVHAKGPAEVIVATAKVQQIHTRLEALGTLRARDSVEITATVTDTITIIHFEDGQRVQKGDILVEMTNAEEHALIEEERYRVEEAEKQYQRSLPLVKRGVETKSQLDQRQQELGSAQARLRATESRLRDRLIIAPFSGVVGLRNISVGALVEPGDLITTLDDDQVMKLDFTVPEIQLAVLELGATIEATTPAFKDEVFAGKISSIDSRIDPSTRSLTVRALIDNPEGILKPGLLMQVEVQKNPREAAMIPEEALIPSGSTNSVLLVDKSTSPPKAIMRQVEIGLREVGQVEVVKGLVEGDQVVTHGGIKVRPGQEILVMAVDDGNTPLPQLLDSNGVGDTQ